MKKKYISSRTITILNSPSKTPSKLRQQKELYRKKEKKEGALVVECPFAPYNRPVRESELFTGGFFLPREHKNGGKNKNIQIQNYHRSFENRERENISFFGGREKEVSFFCRGLRSNACYDCYARGFYVRLDLSGLKWRKCYGCGNAYRFRVNNALVF